MYIQSFAAFGDLWERMYDEGIDNPKYKKTQSTSSFIVNWFIDLSIL